MAVFPSAHLFLGRLCFYSLLFKDKQETHKITGVPHCPRRAGTSLNDSPDSSGQLNGSDLIIYVECQ